MGAKYYPTIKDLKASQRFQRQQKARPKPAKPAVAAAPKPARRVES